MLPVPSPERSAERRQRVGPTTACRRLELDPKEAVFRHPHRSARSETISGPAQGLLHRGTAAVYGWALEPADRGDVDASATTTPPSVPEIRTLRPRHPAGARAPLVTRPRHVRPDYRRQRAVPELRRAGPTPLGTRGRLRRLWSALGRAGAAGARSRPDSRRPGCRVRQGPSDQTGPTKWR